MSRLLISSRKSWLIMKRSSSICRGVLVIHELPLLSRPCCHPAGEPILGNSIFLNPAWFPSSLPQIWEIWFRKCLRQREASVEHGEVDGKDTATVVWERSKGHRLRRGHAKRLTQRITCKQKADPKLYEKTEGLLRVKTSVEGPLQYTFPSSRLKRKYAWRLQAFVCF